jgi:thiosulfate/3-mercaptopyruvate sulfurtransferase
MMEPLVDAAWLERHRSEVVIADVRWYLNGPPGREAYDRGHIPGAVFVDLDADLSAPADPRAGRHPLPTPESFAEALAAVGIGDGDTVIAYDDAGGVVAARLVWMLRTLESRAALLDGGLAGWTGPLESEPAVCPGASFTPRPWPADRIASIEDVAAIAARTAAGGDVASPDPASGRVDPGTVLLDARDRSRYLGDQPDPVDPRAGHIPGAVSLPARESVGPEGRMLSPEGLRERFEGVGVRDGGSVIAYCGSGVTACHDLLMLERAGLGLGRLYPGSWSQWSCEWRRPIATGPPSPARQAARLA